MFSITERILAPHLRLFTIPLHETQAVSVLFLVGVGSRNEQDPQAGISHLLEHMVFKGTRKYPSTKILSEKLDGVGAEFNAFTGEEFTGFWVRAAAEHAPLAIDVVSELVWRAALKKKELTREQHVVLEEIKMYHDMPQAHVQELNQKILFGQSTLARPIIGTPASVSGITIEDLKEWYERWYQSKNIVIVVAGNPLQYDWSALVTERFPAQAAREVDPYLYGAFPTAGPHILGETRSTDQAHLVLSFKTCSYHDQHKYPLWVLSNLLGEMMSSRLFLEVREKRGLAYYVGAGTQEFSDTGYLSVRAGVNPAKAEEALAVIARELVKLKTTAVRAPELTRAKENLKGETTLKLEDSMAIARFVGQQALLLGTVRMPNKIFEDIEAVRSTHLQEIANSFFTNDNLHLSYVGPLSKEEKIIKAAMLKE